MLVEQGRDAVDLIVEMSGNGRIPKNSTALFALAVSFSRGDLETRKAALNALPRVARTGSHLFEFISYASSMRGWGAMLRAAVKHWYEDHLSDKSLAYQMVKYRARNGWSHRDLLRKAHPRFSSEGHNALAKWATDGEVPSGFLIIDCYERLKSGEISDAAEVARLIEDNKEITREMVPTEFLKDPDVWRALLRNMPTGATLRNLGKMTSLGILKPLSDELEMVRERLSPGRLEMARVHPVSVLGAKCAYEDPDGSHRRGSLKWTPVPEVVSLLENAYHDSFVNAPTTGKRLYLAVDVSYSMTVGSISGIPGLSPLKGAAAMAMAIARKEPRHHISAFSSEHGTAVRNPYGLHSYRPHDKVFLKPLGITGTDTLAQALTKVTMSDFLGTDCSLPMRDAMSRGLEVDCFVILTDNETWCGKVHPCEALRKYRKVTGIDAKMVVVGMTSTGFTIADPDDLGTLDVVGFDAAVPQLLADFITR